MKLPPIILASASPRRADLLKLVALDFRVIPAAAVEVAYEHLTPQEVCQLNAHRKARVVAKKHPDALVLGADTLVFRDQEILGKPRNHAEAERMLSRLQGRTHQVVTGVSLMHLRGHREKIFAVSTDVLFHPLTARQIREYLDKIQPLDKAGAYAIQDYGELIVSEISGSYSNVVGLPVEKIEGGIAILGNTLRDIWPIYDRLSDQARRALEQNQPELDQYLPDKSGDPRRGVTLVIRPEPAARDALNEVVTVLRPLAPGQYFYSPSEFHVTVLSLIPGSPDWRRRLRQLPACRALLEAVIARHPAFTLEFRGVTASPGAVMVQGFPRDQAGTLQQIRADLRAAFHEAGLGADLDRRYPVTAAHVTVLRFQQPQPDYTRLTQWLAANRDTVWGETRVTALSLIWGDWYASAQTVRTLRNYSLAS